LAYIVSPPVTTWVAFNGDAVSDCNWPAGFTKVEMGFISKGWLNRKVPFVVYTFCTTLVDVVSGNGVMKVVIEVRLTTEKDVTVVNCRK
jgi:hypothetical protein